MSPASGSPHWVMHFTHLKNLPGILAAGGLSADNKVERGSALLVEAADLDIKDSRRTIQVARPPYGCVADYVPFYFAPRSPMLYKLAKGSVPTYTDGQDPLIYLVSTVENIAATGQHWLFSDGNCASAVTEIFDDLSVLDTVVDWQIMDDPIWKNTADDPDRMRRRMAEFLVHEHVPLTCISGVAARNEAIRRQVADMLAAHSVQLPAWVRAGWYF
jgi:ssDNA thymidine ADP-ribosyltransferase, DarT